MGIIPKGQEIPTPGQKNHVDICSSLWLGLCLQKKFKINAQEDVWQIRIQRRFRVTTFFTSLVSRNPRSKGKFLAHESEFGESGSRLFFRYFDQNFEGNSKQTFFPSVSFWQTGIRKMKFFEILIKFEGVLVNNRR